DGQAGCNQGWHLARGHLIWTIGDRIGWIRVSLNKKTVRTRRKGRFRERRDKLAPATRFSTCGARLLHAVGGIEDGRSAQGLHLRKRAHINHEVLITKRGPTFRLPDFPGLALP